MGQAEGSKNNCSTVNMSSREPLNKYKLVVNQAENGTLINDVTM